MMNLLFRSRHTYMVESPLTEVQTRLRYIVTRRWDDYSMDITGGLSKAGDFSLTDKWAIFHSRVLENYPAYISGKLLPESSDTVIRIALRPNKLFIFLFYLALALLATEVLELEKFINLHKYFKIALPVALCVFSLILIIFYCNRLRKRFEELMQLK